MKVRVEDLMLSWPEQDWRPAGHGRLGAVEMDLGLSHGHVHRLALHVHAVGLGLLCCHVQPAVAAQNLESVGVGSSQTRRQSCTHVDSGDASGCIAAHHMAVFWGKSWTCANLADK